MSTTNATTPPNSSGKKLVTTLILLAALAAVLSWWFRYSATRHAAEFWGSPSATLIRSAPQVTLRSDTPSADAAGTTEADVPRDISKAKGLTHLRNALLEDSSYHWDGAILSDIDWANSLTFAASEGGEPRAVVIFSKDFRWVSNGAAPDPGQHAVATTTEFAEGLKMFFADTASAPAEQ